MANKLVPIKYTSRDFQSIKNDLIEHAKRYYADSYKDFNEGSFASLMLDTVAYVGDMLSFYLDYQANESFLDTASEYNNVLKIAKQMGFKYINGRSSSTVATFYISVPANPTSLGPNMSYAPILKKGSTFSTNNNTKFILNEDVRFDLETNEVRVLKIGQSGNPITYGIKATGLVVSGLIKTEVVSIGEYERFKKISLAETDIVEILSVYDEEGNEYYEVDYLSQNVVYKSFSNTDSNTFELAKEILKPVLVPRRFTVETDLDKTYLQFGASSDSIVTDNKNMIAEPAKTVLEMFGKEYISSDSFDPSRIINSDKFGIAPSNTNITVVYRYNPPGIMLNFGTDALSNVESVEFAFNNEQNLNKQYVLDVKNSLELTNEAPILGESRSFDSRELKIRIKNSFSTQSRAVTSEDYKSMCYAMPVKYGSIKRINVVRDDDSLKRNLNLYVLCENDKGYLTQANQIVKNNLKTWILRNKMINDSIDILDGKVVNYAIEFVAVGMPGKSKYDILTEANKQLRSDFMTLGDFGETFFLTNIWSSLKKVEGILDVVSVDIVPKVGGSYSDAQFNFKKQTSPDKRYMNVPANVVLELKYPNSDIKGTIL